MNNDDIYLETSEGTIHLIPQEDGSLEHIENLLNDY